MWFSLKNIGISYKVKMALRSHLQNLAAFWKFSSKILNFFSTHLSVTKGSYFEKMKNFCRLFLILGCPITKPLALLWVSQVTPSVNAFRVTYVANLFRLRISLNVTRERSITQNRHPLTRGRFEQFQIILLQKLKLTYWDVVMKKTNTEGKSRPSVDFNFYTLCENW